MTRMTLFFAIAAICVALATGCEDSRNLVVPDSQTPGSLDPGNELESAIIEILQANLRGRIDLFHEKQYSGQLSAVISQPGAGLTGESIAIAMFSTAEDGPGIDAGSVSVNDRLLAKQPSETGGLFYELRLQARPTPETEAGGPRYFWGVSGGPRIPAFEAAVDLPAPFSVTSPRQRSTVGRDDSLRVYWQGGSADIALVYLTGFRSEEPGRGAILASYPVPDAGHFTVPGGTLHGISDPFTDLRISVSKYRYATNNQSERKFLLLAAITDFVEVKFR